MGRGTSEVGVLCHLTSLPGPGEHGTLGAHAFMFVDKLAEAGVTVWQILPLTPPDEHASPYASHSAFAAWTELRDPAIHEIPNDDMIEDWITANEHWCHDWALFSVIRSMHDGIPWTKWPVQLRDRHPDALRSIEAESASNIRQAIIDQVSFQRDWDVLRCYAAERGVRLFGDVPIFVAHDSADVWADRTLFQLDAQGMPAVVAGVPPDSFSEDGQRWGTVLYDWDVHRDDEWSWWCRRTAHMCARFDIVRIDHFRGIEAAWAIPPECDTAVDGAWQAGPGNDLIQAICEVAGPDRIVAEDLGVIPSSVIEMRRRWGLPGMAVLQFGFEDDSPLNPHRPVNITHDQVVYTGTHDNDTTMGWWSAATDEQRARVNAYMIEGETPCDTLIRIAVESP
ncbi:MAG TPA: 4-alpha-glucanotransferase, partial [Candidatus Poseidoniales archaeon]|nr:4-alpha-glucanotransferase [Candidatus Poseidoniales archaeon]